MVTFTGRQALVAVDIDNGVAFGDAQQIQSVGFDFEGNLADIHHMGSRDPQKITEGTIEISGTMERLYEAGNFSAMATTWLLACQGNPLTEFWVALFPEGDISPKIMMSNVKFGGWHLGTDVAGNVTENVTYKGLAIAAS